VANAKLTKAVLIPLNAQNEDSAEENWITVQFNPATLKVTLSNTLKDSNTGGGQSKAAQFVDKSESTLAIELVFDTSVVAAENMTQQDGTQTLLHQDVRKLTQKVASEFMQPQDAQSNQPKAPKRCRFQWGSFSFIGMLASYNETLDFFSPEGVPLRATLALTFKQDNYQFDIIDLRNALSQQGQLAIAGAGVSAVDANLAADRDPQQWRQTALYNGMDNPRFSDSQGVVVPPANTVNNNSLPGDNQRAQVGSNQSPVSSGYSHGDSATLGTTIPGAF
jgi:contractile injection system tube protein